MDLPCRNCSVLCSSKGNSSNSSIHSNRLLRPKLLVSTSLAYLEEISKPLNSRYSLRTPMVPSHQTHNSREILLWRHFLEEWALLSLSNNLHSRTNRSRISW